MLAFMSGLVPSELPIQHGTAQLGFAGLSARGGGAKGWRGGLGLARQRRVGRRAGAAASGRQPLRRGARGGAGRGARRGLPQPDRRAVQPAAPDVRLTRRRLLAPDSRRPPALPLVPGHLLRRVRPPQPSRRVAPGRSAETTPRAPVLFQVHGGAWIMGRKEGQAEPLMGHLAERGWVCVAANYRLSPRATWPDHIVDVKRALAWVKANIAEHGGDPDFVVITGGSAGGHLCSLAALTPGLADFQPGFEDADTSVAAAVPFYGVYDFTNRHGTGRADIVPFLEERVFKSALARRPSPLGAGVADQPRQRRGAAVLRPPRHERLARARSSRPAPSSTSCARRRPAPSSTPSCPLAQHAFDVFPSVRDPPHRACRRAVPRRRPQRARRPHAGRGGHRSVLIDSQHQFARTKRRSPCPDNLRR